MVRLKNFIFAGVMCHVSTNFVILQLQSKLKFMGNNLFNNKYRIPSARAHWHDYNHGYFYITICTYKREHFFGEISDCKMSMTKLGLYTESYIEYLNSKHDDFKILSHVIMPNHIHAIFVLLKDAAGASTRVVVKLTVVYSRAAGRVVDRAENVGFISHIRSGDRICAYYEIVEGIVVEQCIRRSALVIGSAAGKKHVHLCISRLFSRNRNYSENRGEKKCCQDQSRNNLFHKNSPCFKNTQSALNSSAPLSPL